MNRRKFLKLIAAAPFLTFAQKAAAEEKKVLLLQTNVAGFRYYEGNSVWPLLYTSDPLELRREPWNAHDDKAVALYWQNSKLGYIPRADNAVIANLLDQKHALTAAVQEKRQTENPWKRLWVRVEMRV